MIKTLIFRNEGNINLKMNQEMTPITFRMTRDASRDHAAAEDYSQETVPQESLIVGAKLSISTAQYSSLCSFCRTHSSLSMSSQTLVFPTLESTSQID